MNARTHPAGYTVYEYLLVLTPHEDLRNRIIHIRKEFQEKYKTGLQGGKPHVTLLRFSQYRLMEERIVNRLKITAQGLPPVKITLKDYASLPTHSIYIPVTSKIAIQNISKQVRSGAQRLMRLDAEHKPHFITEAGIIITRKLLPEKYEKGWLEYQHRHFTGHFIADGMLLLKRPQGTLAYEIVQRFMFENLPVNTIQGDLFS